MRHPFISIALLSTLATPGLASTFSSATVSDFGFVLKDLNAGDAIAPQLSWSNYWSIITSSTDTTQLGWGSAGGYWNPTWADGGFTNSINYSPISSVSTISINGFGHQSASLNASGPVNVTVSSWAEAGQRSDSGAFVNQYFTLSADTQVTFKLKVNGSMGGSSFNGSWTGPGPNTFVDLHSTTYYTGFMAVGANQISLNANGSNGFLTNLDGYEFISEDQGLALTIKNQGTTEKSYSLIFGAAAFSLEVQAPVPEPSSYALMALGLAAVFGLSQRRRACALHQAMGE